MRITAQVTNRLNSHEVQLSTDGLQHTLAVPSKPGGYGSGVNGGELLMLALATCYCNDIYREAAKRGIAVEQVEVEVRGDFGKEGEPAQQLTYLAKVTAHAPQAAIQELMQQTDRLAEIQNTVRDPIPVLLVEALAISV